MRLAGAWVAFVLASGCLASSATGPDVVPAAGPDEARGRTVFGDVLDTEFRPIAGARIIAQGTNQSALSRPDGGFNVTGLPALDDLILSAQHPAFVPQSLRVDLRYVPTARVRFVLPSLPPPLHYWTNISTGLIFCQVAFGGHDGPIEERRSCGNPTPETRERISEPLQAGIQALVIEMTWEPGTPAADILAIHPSIETPLQFVDLGEVHGEPGAHRLSMFIGPSSLRFLQAAPGTIHVDVEVEPSLADDHFPANLGVALHQEFTMYVTQFYGQAPPPTVSFLPES